MQAVSPSKATRPRKSTTLRLHSTYLTTRPCHARRAVSRVARASGSGCGRVGKEGASVQCPSESQGLKPQLFPTPPGLPKKSLFWPRAKGPSNKRGDGFRGEPHDGERAAYVFGKREVLGGGYLCVQTGVKNEGPKAMVRMNYHAVLLRTQLLLHPIGGIRE